jgi:hypothetical protein
LSLDEAVSIHEEAMEPFQHTFNLTGIWYFSWIVPGIAFVCVFALLYFKFLLQLPGQTQRLFLISAILYVLGAVGVEMIGGVLWEDGRSETLLYYVVSSLEELLEMLGINLFLYALMSYIDSHLKPQVFFKES